MHQPGVEVRPLRQMTGGAEFNEVYMTDARVPDESRVGDVGNGWAVAVTTLMNERVYIGGNAPPRGAGMIAMAVDLYTKRAETDGATRDRLMQLWTRAEALRLTNLRASQNRTKGNPGSRRLDRQARQRRAQPGDHVPVHRPDGRGRVPLRDVRHRAATAWSARGYGDPRVSFLRSRANTIEGGTSEVMRNILGERVLGLPGDVRVDRDVPWKDILRN